MKNPGNLGQLVQRFIRKHENPFYSTPAEKRKKKKTYQQNIKTQPKKKPEIVRRDGAIGKSVGRKPATGESATEVP